MLKDAASGAVMYYTTNGAAPTSASTKYTAAIGVSSAATINAVAIASGDSLSPVAQASYTITTTAPAPTFSPLPGSFVTAQSVALTTDVAGATIHYTTNGTTPTAASTAYTMPIEVSSTTTIKAIAVATGFHAYAPGSAVYTIQTQAATPGFYPQPRGYITAQPVTLSDSTTGAAIYYTVDGTTPSVKSAKYSGTAILVSKTTTIKAIAIASGDVSSEIATGVFAIDDASLVEQRVLAQQGIGIGLATQTSSASCHWPKTFCYSARTDNARTPTPPFFPHRNPGISAASFPGTQPRSTVLATEPSSLTTSAPNRGWRPNSPIGPCHST